ncbi:TonB family protein [Altererythrobacter sp. SALINAS58]|uniref:TonB family protein n=1 Tax=Alteripontixanthobacter muriae TaxID=2705546 RepID=UPI001575DB9E|nr:TonB family protein [Alteripontixanthobacter muriae]NTZ44064.1 TonB family protein [Alteripontixanthobacter muriae]
MSDKSGNFTHTRQRIRPLTLVGIAVLHILLFYGLARALAPDFTGGLEESVVAAFTVPTEIPETPPPPVPEPAPETDTRPDEGAQGDPGREAVARAVAAPEPAVTIVEAPPAPRAASTGAANTSGAAEQGEGTGAAGSGSGTGSGQGGVGGGGGGSGAAIARPARKIAGDIRSAADFPVPPGGRAIRRGQSVTVAVTVGVDGRARDCRVLKPSPDPQADQTTCRLVVERFRFEPAVNAAGETVPATYGWRQDFY